MTMISVNAESHEGCKVVTDIMRGTVRVFDFDDAAGVNQAIEEASRPKENSVREQRAQERRLVREAA